MQAVYLKDGDRRLKVSVAKCGFDFLGCRVVNIYIYIYLCIYVIYLCVYIFLVGIFRNASRISLDQKGLGRCCERMKSCADCLRRAPPLKTPKFRRRGTDWKSLWPWLTFWGRENRDSGKWFIGIQ